MTILKWVFRIIQGILASVGMSAIMIVYLCMFTTTPEELFQTLHVDTKIQKADAIVVLGSGVTRNGWPDRISLERTVQGVILFKQGYAPRMIFAGGWAHNGYEASAPVMAKIAQELGVPPHLIIIEDQSKDTYQNALFTQKVLKENGWQTMLLVTSESHMKRSALTFSKLGLTVFPVPVEAALPKQELRWTSKIQNFNIMFQVLYEAAAGLKYKTNGWI